MKKKKRKLNVKRTGITLITLVLMIGIALVIIKQLQPKTEAIPQPQVEDKKDDSNEFESLYFYDQQRLDRYQDYKKKNPEMTVDEIVWRVNVDIDQPNYENQTVISEKDENNALLLVNKHFMFREEFEPTSLVEFEDGYYCTPETYEAYQSMHEAALEDGLDLAICSAYRSMDTQTRLYDNAVASSGVETADLESARPGSSEHHTGRAIDFIGPSWDLDDFVNTEEFTWLSENAWKYGFILRYPENRTDVTGYIYESWHYTYVGQKAAKIMHEQGIETFEEYYVKYVMYQPSV